MHGGLKEQNPEKRRKLNAEGQASRGHKLHALSSGSVCAPEVEGIPAVIGLTCKPMSYKRIVYILRRKLKDQR